MTFYLRSVGGMLGGLFPNSPPTDKPKPLCDSRAAQTNIDYLWTRSRFLGGSSSFAFNDELNNAYDLWEWDLFVQTDGKIGQRRDGLTGITRDSTGAVLGSVDLVMFDDARDEKVDKTTSDATTGAYSLTTPYTGATVYIYAYKSGTPVQGGSAKLTPA